jgi:L-ribulose-5-phosphate 4-epimerase
MRQHGVFAIGKDGKSALKAAVMCEDAAKSVSVALQVGEPVRLADEIIDALFNRYQNVYGQL